MARNKFARFGTVWYFRTKRFRIELELERDHNYQYDGDDEDGETQRAIEDGDLVAFDSTVTVYLDGIPIARNDLGGSVYKADDVAAFYTDHRSADPMNRNCSIMRKANGGNAVICHYFPSMVTEAISEAREILRTKQVYIRESA